MIAFLLDRTVSKVISEKIILLHEAQALKTKELYIQISFLETTQLHMMNVILRKENVKSLDKLFSEQANKENNIKSKFDHVEKEYDQLSNSLIFSGKSATILVIVGTSIWAFGDKVMEYL